MNPAVSLRAACFGKNQYEDVAFQKCFSNLLGVGFRKFIVDVYWDAEHLEWSLCPAEIPPSTSTPATFSATLATPTSSSTSSPRTPSLSSSSSSSSSAASTIGNGSPDARRAAPTAVRDEENLIEARQEEPPSFSSARPSGTSSPTLSNTPSTPLPSPTGPQPGTSNQVLSIGSYNCTSTITLRFLTGIFEAFLDETSTTTDAALSFLVLNIHAASSWATPDAPAQRPPSDRLPGAGNLLSDIVKGNLTDELYTADTLRGDRANLGGSWYKVDYDNLPAQGYYRVSQDASGHRSTPDGWPTVAYLEFQELLRVSVVFGTIDPQMSVYDTTPDSASILPADYVNFQPKVSINDDGTISSGCLFAQTESSITASTNSSWALATIPDLNIDINTNPYTPIPSITNLTSCGLSPFINTTISSASADKAPLPYAAFVQSTLWSWAPGEPQNVSSTPNRCAVMHIAAPYPGRWFTADCSEQHRVACQDPSKPYNWTISQSSTRYFDADAACASPLVFSVPHTALENAHLLSSSSSSSMPDSDSQPIFVNLNSLDIDACWVTSINGTCPYLPTTDTDRTRVVVVPTVAAVMIFVLAALTFFVKCAANRREDKRGRRRRMVGGWEYEGVPS